MDCYLLVGGRSRRMGVAKASLPFGDSTFIGRVAATARLVFDRVVAVDRAVSPESQAEWPEADATIHESRHEDEAAIFGVARALEESNRKCFVLAVDYPLITADVLRKLSERFEASAAPMLIPVWRGLPQPLCAGYAVSMRELIGRNIAEGRYDLRSLAGSNAELVEINGIELMNVNTPEELEEAKSAYERQELLPSR